MSETERFIYIQGRPCVEKSKLSIVRNLRGSILCKHLVNFTINPKVSEFEVREYS